MSDKKQNSWEQKELTFEGMDLMLDTFEGLSELMLSAVETQKQQLIQTRNRLYGAKQTRDKVLEEHNKKHHSK